MRVIGSHKRLRVHLETPLCRERDHGVVVVLALQLICALAAGQNGFLPGYCKSVDAAWLSQADWMLYAQLEACCQG